jgi:hypothetical protein
VLVVTVSPKSHNFKLLANETLIQPSKIHLLSSKYIDAYSAHHHVDDKSNPSRDSHASKENAAAAISIASLLALWSSFSFDDDDSLLWFRSVRV